MSAPTLAAGIPGDPALVEEGARAIGTAGSRVQEAGADVRQHADAVVAQWSGSTADAAHEKIRLCATRADAAGESIAEVGPVLTTYAAALRQAQKDYAAALAKGLAADQAQRAAVDSREAQPVLGERTEAQQQIVDDANQADADATADATDATGAMGSAKAAEEMANQVAAAAVVAIVAAIDEATALTSGRATPEGAGRVGDADEPFVVEEYSAEDAYSAGILAVAGGYGESTKIVEYSDGSYDLITGTSGEAGLSWGWGVRGTAVGIPGALDIAVGASASAALVAGGSTQELRRFGSKAEMLVYQEQGQTVLTKVAGVMDGRGAAPLWGLASAFGIDTSPVPSAAASLLGDTHPPDAYVFTNRLDLDGAVLGDQRWKDLPGASQAVEGSLGGEIETRVNRDGSSALTLRGTALASAVASTVAGAGEGGRVMANPALTLTLDRGGQQRSLTTSYEGASLDAEGGPGGRSSGSVTEYSATWDATGPAGASMVDTLTSAAGAPAGDRPYDGSPVLSLGPPDETSSSRWTVDSTEPTGVDVSAAVLLRAGFASTTHSSSTRTLEPVEVSR